ncbi:uncharacterized protein V6R79_023325 [Siganus canaliculatus]
MNEMRMCITAKCERLMTSYVFTSKLMLRNQKRFRFTYFTKTCEHADAPYLTALAVLCLCRCLDQHRTRPCYSSTFMNSTASERSLFVFGYHSEMSSLLQPKANATANVRFQASHELILFAMLSTGSSCSFLYINSVLLFTLRNKRVFCETPRYILLYNLLFADTAHLVSNLLLYSLAYLRIKITYYTCVCIILPSSFTALISPLTLAVMSIERFVAVCHPLRHPCIFNMKSAGISIALVWTFSLISVLARVFMLLYLYLFRKISLSQQLKDFCSKEAVFFAPIFNDFEQVYASSLFLLVSITIMSSYIGVVFATRAVSRNKSSARKALQTLLLHLIQLSLILISTLFSAIIATIARAVDRSTLVRVYNVCFVYLNILPRCLSALIYGLRDQTIRPILMRRLCCQR